MFHQKIDNLADDTNLFQSNTAVISLFYHKVVLYVNMLTCEVLLCSCTFCLIYSALITLVYCLSILLYM